MIPNLHSHPSQAGSEASGQRTMVKQEPMSPKPASGSGAKVSGKMPFLIGCIDNI